MDYLHGLKAVIERQRVPTTVKLLDTTTSEKLTFVVSGLSI